MKVVVYKTEDEAANQNLKHVAYLFNGGIPLGIRFFGATSKVAKEKANTWLKDQRPTIPLVESETTEEQFTEWKEGQPEPVVQKRHKHVTEPRTPHVWKQTWMVNRQTKTRKRVPIEQIQTYLDQGFERGKAF